jgi:hypothetical protein
VRCACHGFSKGLAPVAAFSDAELVGAENHARRRDQHAVVQHGPVCSMRSLHSRGCARSCALKGQAAMELEFACRGVATEEAYHFPLVTQRGGPMVLDWAPVVEAIIWTGNGACSVGGDGGQVSQRAGGSHRRRGPKRFAQNRVVLSGGCFQNRYLTGARGDAACGGRDFSRTGINGCRQRWRDCARASCGGAAALCAWGSLRTEVRATSRSQEIR